MIHCKWFNHDDLCIATVLLNMQLLPEDVRRSYLAKLIELLKLDNSHNWRFREELAMFVGMTDFLKLFWTSM